MVKKTLKVKKQLFEKVDQIFHRSFFGKKNDFENVGLELVVEENIDGDNHNFSTRGNYLEPRRNAFRKISDRIEWDKPLPLARDYAAQIAKDIDSRIYAAEVDGNRTVVRANVSKGDVEKTIQDYVASKGGYLNKEQFRKLTGATETDLRKLAGARTNLETKRYTARNVLDCSRRFCITKDVEMRMGRRRFDSTYSLATNILNIYRKILDEVTPKPEQATLF